MGKKDVDGRYISAVFRCRRCGRLTDVTIARRDKSRIFEIFCVKCLMQTEHEFVRTWPPARFSVESLRYFVENAFGFNEFRFSDLRSYMRDLGYSNSEIQGVLNIIKNNTHVFSIRKKGRDMYIRLLW